MEDIEKIILDYYQYLLTSNKPTPTYILRVVDIVQSCVAANMNEFLERSFIEDEVREAVFDHHSSKAPGQDGFPACFFQNSWDCIGTDLVKYTLSILNEGRFDFLEGHYYFSCLED